MNPVYENLLRSIIRDMDFPKLDQAKMRKINDWVAIREEDDMDEVIIELFGDTMTRGSIQSLDWNPPEIVSTDVFDFYLKLIDERSQSDERLPTVYAWDVYFLDEWRHQGYPDRLDNRIFSSDIILFPFWIDVPIWGMAVIHLQEKTIKCYDPTGEGYGPHNLDDFFRYIKRQSIIQGREEFHPDLTAWTAESVPDIPIQEDENDSIVFCCMYAEFISRNRPIPIVFTQDKIEYFRKKMVYEICTGELLN